MDFVVAFHGGEQFGKGSNRVPLSVIGGLLGQDSSGSKVRTVGLHAGWFGVIGEDKDWRGGNLFLENVKGGLFFGAPFPFIAEDTDMEFKTAWNAGVIMHMQNASRPLEQNLGLAKDVPCFSNHFTTHLHTDMENRWKREGLG